MANVGGIDENSRRALFALSNVDNSTLVNLWADPITHRLLVDTSGTTASLVVGTTTVTGGTTTRILYDNAGVLGELSVVPVTTGGTGTTNQFTQGSVIFAGASGVYSQDNTNLFYTSSTRMLSVDATGTTTSFHTGPTAGTSNLAVGGAGIEIIGTNNTAGGMNIVFGNKSAGNSAFTSLFIQNDLADATGTHFGNIGLNSSTYNDTAFGTAFNTPNQLQLWGTDGPTLIGTTKSGSYVNFIAGGSASTNEIGRFTTAGLTVGLTGTLTGAIKFAGATSTQITLQGQTIGASGVLTLPAVTDTVAVLAAAQAFTNKSYNGLTLTATTGTFTLTNAKTFAVTNGLTLSGTDSTVMTFPTTTATIARTDAAQTFTGTQTFSQVITTANAITAVANAATVPVTSKNNIVTNSSAATLTITLTTASAVNMQQVVVQILDFSAVAQTITWVNTENSTITAPTTSNGSTSLPLTVGFTYNSSTSKWRCVASA